MYELRVMSYELLTKDVLLVVVNDYALVCGWVNHVAENVVPNACRIDSDVFYTRLNSGSGEIKCDDSIGFLDLVQTVVCKWCVLGDILRTGEWHFWFGFGSGVR